MSPINDTDKVLKALYDRRAYNGMISIMAKLKYIGQPIPMEELIEIKEKLELTRFAIFKKTDNGNDMDGAITQSGIHFVLTNSFTKPGTSILKLI